MSDSPCDRQADRCESRNGVGLEARRLPRDKEVGFQHLKSRYKVVEPVVGAWDGETLTTTSLGNIEALLGESASRVNESYKGRPAMVAPAGYTHGNGSTPELAVVGCNAAGISVCE